MRSLNQFRTIRSAVAFSLITSAALICFGCGKKGASTQEAPAATWSNPQYHMSATYPSDWLINSTPQVEDPKTGETTVVLWEQAGTRSGSTAQQRPPYVMIRYQPGATAPAPAGSSNLETSPEQQPEVLGVPTVKSDVTAGWLEFGAQDIQSKDTQFAGVAAQEGTALLKAGSAAYSTYTGQLAGKDELLRVIIAPAATGRYEITRVAEPNSPALAQADQIVDSIRFTK
ncbi:MAG: hypothetical protein IT209_12430 [Armatimonadetes bacterium]|nr:hypothetical protein [Armatimonadota bacterium]